MKVCPSCLNTKNDYEYDNNSSRKDGLSVYCKICMKMRYNSNRGNDYHRRKVKRDAIKIRVMKHYSSGRLICHCCGERNIEFLTMDHINNDGAEHRRKIGRTPTNLFKWIIDNNFPPSFQLLCFNCNCAKEYSGGCPHQTKKHDPKPWLNLLDQVESLTKV